MAPSNTSLLSEHLSSPRISGCHCLTLSRVSPLHFRVPVTPAKFPLLNWVTQLHVPKMGMWVSWEGPCPRAFSEPFFPSQGPSFVPTTL